MAHFSQENLETFLAMVETTSGSRFPNFIEKEFRDYLRCGILAYGFLRAQCVSCKKENLIAFSCKRRGFCPSCGGRRMSETAAHLADQILPIKPIRQWVLSFPIPIRLILAVRPKIMAEVLHITNTCISAYLRRKAGLKRSNSKTGAVTLIQRFGSSINLNPHFHQMVIDGVYEIDEAGAPKAFHCVDAPSKKELERVLKTIIARVITLLEKRGLITKDEDHPVQLDIPAEDPFSRLQAQSVSYRFAFGPNKGRKAFTLKSAPDPDHNSVKGLVANHSGFSLHAGVWCAGNERKKLERVCRYIARPAIALDRLSLNSKGQVVYELKKPYSDGTTHIVMEPLEFLEKLASIVPTTATDYD
jgi:Putative transposase/Transposase zinc-binding domain